MKDQWNSWTPDNWSVLEAEWNDPALPMITLGVLNYNRCNELRQTLDVLTRAVQYPNYEIIVVDNGSTDGSIEMVRRNFPMVRLCEGGGNVGVSARNRMTSLARGKYLFSFDDDSCPGTPAMTLRMVQHMEKYSDIGALSGSCYQPVTGIMETREWERYRFSKEAAKGMHGDYIVEGGVCFRVAALKTVDGYDPRWLYGCEGMDLGLQLYKCGQRTYLCQKYLTLHFISESMRAPGRRSYMNSRHMVWMIAKHWPIPFAIPLFVLLIPRRLLAMLMHRASWTFNIRGLYDGFAGIRPFFEAQPKLSLRQILALRRFYLFLFRWA